MLPRQTHRRSYVLNRFRDRGIDVAFTDPVHIYLKLCFCVAVSKYIKSNLVYNIGLNQSDNVN
jgi:hypothetical protein